MALSFAAASPPPLHIALLSPPLHHIARNSGVYDNMADNFDASPHQQQQQQPHQRVHPVVQQIWQQQYTQYLNRPAPAYLPTFHPGRAEHLGTNGGSAGGYGDMKPVYSFEARWVNWRRVWENALADQFQSTLERKYASKPSTAACVRQQQQAVLWRVRHRFSAVWRVRHRFSAVWRVRQCSSAAWRVRQQLSAMGRIQLRPPVQ
jgi:hypothetical protein